MYGKTFRKAYEKGYQEINPRKRAKNKRLLDESLKFLKGEENTKNPEGTLKALFTLYEEIDTNATQDLIALHTHIEWQAQKRTIWMDGRDHPTGETTPHTWGGFSTGEFVGDTLVVHTTHLKAGWIRRNGMAISDQATLDEYFFLNDDATLMTHVSIVSDPIYLTEPFVRTNGFEWLTRAEMGPYPCRPAIELDRASGVIPHWMMNSDEASVASEEFAGRWGIPLEATRGGAHTALPEYMDEL